MTKQAESCKTRSLRARKAVRKPPETVRKRNHLGSLTRLPATRKAFSGSETAVPCSETAPSGGAFFAIFILQINGTVRGGTVRGQFCSFGHYPPSPDRLASEIKRVMWNIPNLTDARQLFSETEFTAPDGAMTYQPRATPVGENVA